MKFFGKSFYQKKILPRLIHAAMNDAELARDRQRVVGKAAGVVLEIGFGSGLNLPFYSSKVKKLYGLDPSEQLWRLAQSAVNASAFPVQFVHASAEKIPLSDESIDCVVATWTFCSIAHHDVALAEARRVLKPSGKFFFVEHGESPEPTVAKWQRRLDSIWIRLSGGCHLSRRIDHSLEDQGFHLEGLEHGYWKGNRRRTKLLTYFYSGSAIKPT